jgi:hypothetical protein
VEVDKIIVQHRLIDTVWGNLKMMSNRNEIKTPQNSAKWRHISVVRRRRKS